jgi:hypothetical protein
MQTVGFEEGSSVRGIALFTTMRRLGDPQKGLPILEDSGSSQTSESSETSTLNYTDFRIHRKNQCDLLVLEDSHICKGFRLREALFAPAQMV